MTEDRFAVACNFVEATSVARAGALAYVIVRTGGNDQRIHLLVRSRGGHWVDKWEAIGRIGNYRLKTIPPGHPLYDDYRVARARSAAEYVLADDVLGGPGRGPVGPGREIIVPRDELGG